ncbi:MAG: autotransporter domain-containing protein [Advenella sp.]
MNKLKTLALAISLSFMAPSAYAIEEQLITSPTGQTVFKLRFFGIGDGSFMPADRDPRESTRTISALDRSKLISALSYWAEILKPAPGALPAIIKTGALSIPDAFATFSPLEDKDEPFAYIPMQVTFAGEPGSEMLEEHGSIAIGVLNFDTLDYIPSQIPRPDGPWDQHSTLFHELGHTLGILSLAYDTNGTGTPHFYSFLSAWGKGLRDDNGNPARPGQAILCSLCNNPESPDAFDVRQDQGYFTGKNVQEVLAGAMPGMPVKMLMYTIFGENKLDDNYMSHFELKNSLMSHQTYRNYTNFMELELAVIQDLGFDIDRRNFFGYSVYGNDQYIENNNGFFLRNPEGTAYIPGQYNTATLGLGLHIYGNRNTLIQRSDLLSIGGGGAGVRVDGEANHLVIPSGTRVYADGLNGRGIMFAYGKNHQLNIRGDVQAMGDLGIGVNFDFGNNPIGNNDEYRGSYIHTFFRGTPYLPEELNGALVDTFDLTGRVAGKEQAIYLSRNALVNRINIMQGARIEGNIRSDYAQLDENGNPRLTRISFGQLADTNGYATGLPDAHFNWQYNGNITGRNNIELLPMGGTTRLNGQYDVYGVNVAAGATLGGNGRYVLHPNGHFINNGTLSPGNSIGRIDIAGNYLQTPTGRLIMEVNGQQKHDLLAVSGNATLNGQLTVVPQRDWYGQNWQLQSANLVQAGAIDGTFNTVSVNLDSPTLSVEMQPLQAGNMGIRIFRQPNAYRQYAQNSNAQGVGKALDTLATLNAPQNRSLLQTLDFSASNGQVVTQALNQLTPAIYSTMVASSLNREQQIGNIMSSRATGMNNRLGTPASDSDSATGFVVPFGGGVWQDTRGSLVGYNSKQYGVVLGAEKHSASNPAWTWGAYGAISRQSVHFDDPYSGKGHTTGFNLGLHARYAPQPLTGMYAFGQAQLGIEDGKLHRNIKFEGYAARQSSSWTGWSGSLLAGGGYRWALGERISAGPMASLAYTRLYRPKLNESGAEDSRLVIKSSHFNSLRSSLGFTLDMGLPTSQQNEVLANLQVSWDRELLNKKASLHAHFDGSPEAAFTTQNKVTERDSLGIRAGLTYQVDKNLMLSAQVSSQLFKAGQNSLAGHLSVNWQF